MPTTITHSPFFELFGKDRFLFLLYFHGAQIVLFPNDRRQRAVEECRIIRQNKQSVNQREFLHATFIGFGDHFGLLNLNTILQYLPVFCTYIGREINVYTNIITVIYFITWHWAHPTTGCKIFINSTNKILQIFYNIVYAVNIRFLYSIYIEISHLLWENFTFSV